MSFVHLTMERCRHATGEAETDECEKMNKRFTLYCAWLSGWRVRGIGMAAQVFSHDLMTLASLR